MSTFRITVGYGDGEPQELGSGLRAEQVEQAVGAFMRDMLWLPGSAVSRFTVEREKVAPEDEGCTCCQVRSAADVLFTECPRCGHLPRSHTGLPGGGGEP